MNDAKRRVPVRDVVLPPTPMDERHRMMRTSNVSIIRAHMLLDFRGSQLRKESLPIFDGFKPNGHRRTFYRHLWRQAYCDLGGMLFVPTLEARQLVRSTDRESQSGLEGHDDSLSLRDAPPQPRARGTIWRRLFQSDLDDLLAPLLLSQVATPGC